jgi:hypothetical protein
MPRVNRDLQRRLAARRERERRRPTERRYNFATTEPEIVDAAAPDAEVDGDVDLEAEALEAETVGTEVGADASAPAERALSPAARTASTRTTGSSSASETVRGGQRSTYRPFSDYQAEYAYVYRDLRRVAAVVGGLLVALLVLYFALPILVH